MSDNEYRTSLLNISIKVVVDLITIKSLSIIYNILYRFIALRINILVLSSIDSAFMISIITTLLFILYNTSKKFKKILKELDEEI